MGYRESGGARGRKEKPYQVLLSEQLLDQTTAELHLNRERFLFTGLGPRNKGLEFRSIHLKSYGIYTRTTSRQYNSQLCLPVDMISLPAGRAWASSLALWTLCGEERESQRGGRQQE